jgi:hypothetical protein
MFRTIDSSLGSTLPILGIADAVYQSIIPDSSLTKAVGLSYLKINPALLRLAFGHFLYICTYT